MSEEGKRFAFFDLDHTLIPHDTQLLFCNFVLRHEGWRRCYVLFFLPVLGLGLFRIVGTKGMKRVFLSYLWRMRRERLEALVAAFVDKVFMEEMHPELKEEIEKHREAGRVLVLNSASPEFYVRAIGEKLGFDYAHGTRVVVEDGGMPLVPVIEGANNKCEAKIPRMKAILPEGAGDEIVRIADSYAYSDSAADLPLLALAEHPVMVDPNARLREAGESAGWEELETERHRNHASSLRQAFGLY